MKDERIDTLFEALKNEDVGKRAIAHQEDERGPARAFRLAA